MTTYRNVPGNGVRSYVQNVHRLDPFKFVPIRGNQVPVSLPFPLGSSPGHSPVLVHAADLDVLTDGGVGHLLAELVATSGG